MQPYLNEIIPALDWLLRQPADGFARWLTLGLAVLAGTITLYAAGRGFRFERCNFWLCLIAVLAAWALALAGVAVTRVHLPGHIVAWGFLAMTAFIFGVLIVCGLMRVNYWTALLPWCAALAAMAGVIMLTQGVFQSIGTGNHQTDMLRQQHRNLREFTGD